MCIIDGRAGDVRPAAVDKSLSKGPRGRAPAPLPEGEHPRVEKLHARATIYYTGVGISRPCSIHASVSVVM